MNKSDIIIIGSGLGALECAALLSKRGRDVVVLERQMQPGGCMQSYQRKGHYYDTGLHYVGGLGEGQALHSTFKDLGLLALPWKRLDSSAFDKVTICGETFDYAEGYDNFMHRLAERFPHEKEGLKAYIDVLQQCDDRNMQYADVNAWEWLHQVFHDELLIAVLSGASLKMELRKETLPLFTFAHGNSSFIQSSWRLQGDGNMIVRRLIDVIKENGGRVLCNHEVVELIETDGRVTSALCSNGERYDADIFISNAHPSVTCSLVKESKVMKNIYKKRIGRLDNTTGMFTCSLKVKDGIVPYFNHNKFIYTSQDVWELPSRADGSGILVSARVPKDGESHLQQIDILTPMSWEECKPWENTTIGHRGDDYREMKSRKAKMLVALAETQVPGLADAIEECYCSTPLTYRDYNLSPYGSAYGIRKDCTQPMMTILSPRTPIPNLLMTGQNLMLHGLHGVTMTALFTCREIE